MRFKSAFLAILLCAVASPAVAADKKAPKVKPLDVMLVAYECDQGVTLEVSYINGASPLQAAAVMHADGRLIALPISRSASGARYAWEGPGGYVWWTKGLEGTLYFTPEGGKEKTLLTCKEYQG